MNRVFISHLSQARQSLEGCTGSVLLIADPNLIGMWGIEYFVLMLNDLKREFSHLSLSLGIPCHQSPKLVFSSLNHPIDGIFFEDSHPLWPKMVSIGHNHGIFVQPMKEVMDGLVQP